MVKKIYKPDNHKLQAGSWLKKFLGHEAARIFLALFRGVRQHAPLENFENQRSQIGYKCISGISETIYGGAVVFLLLIPTM